MSTFLGYNFISNLLLWVLLLACPARSHNSGNRISAAELVIHKDLWPSQIRQFAIRGASSSGSLDSVSSSTQSSQPTGTQTSSSPTATASITIPRPFDSILGENFTQPSCPTFFDTFINNSTFQSCIPFSLLLQNSRGFFQAAHSASTLNPLLDSSCAAPFNTCNALMSDLAKTLVSPNICGEDYNLGNPLVIRAYNGLISYGPLFRSSCLKADPIDRTDGTDFPYCYASALNSSSQADSEMYFLPLGVELPAGNSVSCSACTQKTMGYFAEAASNDSNPLNRDYIGAAKMVNSACGANFVNASSSVTGTASGTSKNSGYQKRQSKFTITILVLAATALSYV